MIENITREQYNNAVRIRENGYRCHDVPAGGIGCFNCGMPRDCGSYVDGASSGAMKIREKWIDSRISTYEAEHPEEFRTLCQHQWVGTFRPDLNFATRYCIICHETDVSSLSWHDTKPKIKLTRSELISIADKSRGVKPEQIVVEE